MNSYDGWKVCVFINIANFAAFYIGRILNNTVFWFSFCRGRTQKRAGCCVSPVTAEIVSSRVAATQCQTKKTKQWIVKITQLGIKNPSTQDHSDEIH
jgi:hypothetical protein